MADKTKIYMNNNVYQHDDSAEGRALADSVTANYGQVIYSGKINNQEAYIVKGEPYVLETKGKPWIKWPK
jgi:hypothetical protein